jgi:hypothetical protein
MSGPLGNKVLPPIDKKEYIRLDSNNRIPDVPDHKLFASLLTRDYNVTEQEKLEAKKLILDLIKDTFVEKSTLQNYALNSDLKGYQPVGNYVIQDELKNYALNSDLKGYQPVGNYVIQDDLKKDLDNYQIKGTYLTQNDLVKGDYITKTEVSSKYQPIGQYALVSDLSRYQLNTPATPFQNPVILPITNTLTSIPIPEQAKIQSIVQQPIVQQPIVQDPILQQPIVQDPILQQPIVQDPIVQSGMKM